MTTIPLASTGDVFSPVELIKLAERVENCTRADNELDVIVEIALFKPNSVYSAIRANTAGTKIVCTDRAGNQVTCWSEDWTMVGRRKSTASALRARAALAEQR